jgi:hypothetical protein
LVARHLNQDVSCRAESVKTKALGVTRHSESAISNKPRAKQRGRLQVGIAFRNWETEPAIGHNVFSVTSIDLVTCELGFVAEVFASGLTVRTMAAGSTQPRNSNSVSESETFHLFPCRRHPTYNLVPWNERKFWVRELTVGHMQVSSADGAGIHPHHNLVGLRFWNGNFPKRQGLARRFKNHCEHRTEYNSGDAGSETRVKA